jgi:UDP-glucose 4-epimerase
MSGKRSLITGGAGFIGSHLAETLVKMGEEVVVIDDLSTGRWENISHLKDNKSFRFIKGNILNKAVLKGLIEDCSAVYHLAAAVGVKFIIDNPIKSIEINIKGTENVASLASKEKKKVLFASTSEIYGKKECGSLKEDDDRILGTTKIARWSYSCTKAVDEFLLFAYHRQQGLPMVIVRLFNACGPRQIGEYGMVIPRFKKQALSGEPITVYGDGRQTRSFTYITDVVEAMIALMNHPGAVGEAFNIGSEEGITILALAEKIKALAKSKSEITLIPYEKAYEKGFEDMRHRIPDLGKVRKLINYAPKVSLNEMLRKIVLGE